MNMYAHILRPALSVLRSLCRFASAQGWHRAVYQQLRFRGIDNAIQRVIDFIIVTGTSLRAPLAWAGWLYMSARGDTANRESPQRVYDSFFGVCHHPLGVACSEDDFGRASQVRLFLGEFCQ